MAGGTAEGALAKEGEGAHGAEPPEAPHVSDMTETLDASRMSDATETLDASRMSDALDVSDVPDAAPSDAAAKRMR